jgi:F0F1-type ATP synthase assembly protein I
VLSLRRRRGRKLTKMLVALVAGSVCGALWMLLLDTVANTISTDTMNEAVVLLVGVLTAVVAALFLSVPESLSKVAGLSMVVIGFHSLALPIGTLISFVAAGAAWLPGASAERRAVGLSVAGLLVGVLLVFLGDRALRIHRMRVRRRDSRR